MDFYKRMQIVCRRIPWGRVATYGQIALLCGKPQNSRQVGYGLHHELAGDVPAHRIVNASGILSGAASFDDPDLQKRLLEAEGIPVLCQEGSCRVELGRWQWKNTLKEAEELAFLFQQYGI